jgi:putative hydrolase of the HAD superfamily
MINVVLFDLGNVILPVDGHRMAQKLTKHSPFSPDEILSHFGKKEMLDEFETGRLSNEDFFNHIKERCSFNGLDYHGFLPMFNDIFEEDPSVIALIEELKSHVKLGMISNTNAIHATHLVARYQLFSHFHKVWFSNDVGLRKPDAKIYQIALDHFRVKPEETVFIDDLLPNIEGARKLGIHGIHYRSYEHLVDELNKLGVLNQPAGSKRRIA